jgi:hypothetical protein
LFGCASARKLIEIRPHVGAGPTHKPRLNVGQPDIIGPVVAADAIEWLQR